MTDENRRENVRLELERAEATALAVDALLRGGFWAEAVSRSYYGMFYLARALLYSVGQEVRTHNGVVRQISLHFVRTGLLAPELIRRYSQMQQSREDADYQTALVFDKEAAEAARTALADFRQAARSHLRGLWPDLVD